MSTFIRLFMLILLVNASLELFPQMRFHRNNQFDTDGKKHGYWIEVSKSDPGKKIFKGWYDHGKETKKCIYYIDGIKCSKYRYVNDSLMRIKRYNPNGNLEYKGSALWLTNNKEMRFCWDGEFVFYDTHRRKIKKVTYIRGVEQDLEDL